MIARIVTVAAFSALIATSGMAQAAAADPNAPKPGPNAGDVAPDFTGKAADIKGPLAKPIALADLKGKTVILAFFPRARTGGCTAQMTSYRDQYAKLFNGGKDVVLLGVSNDADTTLAAWAKEQNFPFQFISDLDGSIGRKYGTMTETSKAAQRYVYVIGPDGKIAYTKKPFSPLTPGHYEELGAEIHKTMGAHPHK
jgi:peroxiredoxin Q/BCP